MKPDEFVSRLRLAVIEENTALYRKIFADTAVEKASDPYWKRALALFNVLSPEQQGVFLEVVRQVAVDTTSNVLGIIDGVNALDGVDAEFELSCSTGSKLSGDLQSLFLIEEERAAPK
jgi:hypothetical protein